MCRYLDCLVIRPCCSVIIIIIISISLANCCSSRAFILVITARHGLCQHLISTPLLTTTSYPFTSFLTYSPERRITADKAMTHAYFNERPRAIDPSMFPSWPAKSERSAATTNKTSPRPPVGGGALAAAAVAAADTGRIRYQPPAPPMGGQRFYSSMGVAGATGVDSRPGTVVGSGDASGQGLDKGFLLRF